MEERIESNNDPKWRLFEKEVARIHGLFSPHASINHDKKEIDRFGNKRQFDVVIRDKWGGNTILVIIECKNTARPVDVGEIDAFITKSRNILSNINIMVSKSGFTDAALRLARAEGIVTQSLLPRQFESEIPFVIGHHSFAKIYNWKEFKIKLQAVRREPIPSLDLREIKIRDTYLVDWFRNELESKFKTYKREGWVVYDFQFPKSVIMKFGNTRRKILRIAIGALRKKQVKTKFLRVEGDALYDWQQKNWILPPNGWLEFGTIDTHKIHQWDDFDGIIPEIASRGIAMDFVGYERMEPAPQVLDMTKIFNPTIGFFEHFDNFFKVSDEIVDGSEK